MFTRGQILGFGTPVDINVTLEDAASRRRVLVPPWSPILEPAKDNYPSTLYVFGHRENIKGEVIISTEPGESVEYTEMKVEFVGQINTLTPDAKDTVTFFCQHQELEKALPGSQLLINEVKVVNFCFNNVTLPFESYNGISTQLRYFLRVTIHRPFAPDVVEEHDIWVQNPQEEPAYQPGIKMEVGLEKYLHIEFEYNKKNYHLQDVVLGKIYFVVVKLRIRQMELALLKREIAASNQESETIAKYEIMDGNPVAGESIPVRVFLAPFKLTPTYRLVNNQFSVKYYLNLVLVDEDDKRYYKQQEINLWRRYPTSATPTASSPPPASAPEATANTES
eukprot:Sspe_Gene.52539::Locus_29100_Transcript_2_2_Confidence_0.667_Length_1251::g.52539::m.52539/K18466/VPS26; vacuolar protein sorting-associated protein 26